MRAQRRARAVFGDAAAQARSSAAEFDMAAHACAMAGDTRGEQALRGRAGRARDMAQVADGRASLAGGEARETRAASREWKTNMGWWADGAAWPGDRAALAGRQEGIRAAAERARTK